MSNESHLTCTSCGGVIDVLLGKTAESCPWCGNPLELSPRRPAADDSPDGNGPDKFSGLDPNPGITWVSLTTVGGPKRNYRPADGGPPPDFRKIPSWFIDADARKGLALLPVAAVALVIAGLSIYFSINYSGTPGTSPRPDAASGLAAGGEFPEAPEIITDKLTAGFHNNRKAGSIFVISGMVKHNFPHERSLIKVKGFLKDSNGTVVAETEAFAGNTLTDRELDTLAMNQILIRLDRNGSGNNINFHVQPESWIPFTLVFDNPPSNIPEYVVEYQSSFPAGNEPQVSRSFSYGPFNPAITVSTQRRRSSD
ncbi:MAG: DUF3426 domain-containing protein [Deltaproteobacteria bacterium]|jgi:hypothetical protein|nr:DUF3426 domain-containing protein [Deltaproteobacteria bacterium]